MENERERERAGRKDEDVSSTAGEEKPMNDWHCKHEADAEDGTKALPSSAVVPRSSFIGRSSHAHLMSASFRQSPKGE